MKKIIFLVLTILLLNIVHWSGDRVCKTLYTSIGWVNYFAWLLCTEDINLSWVIWDTPSLKDVSDWIVNDFIALNNYNITEHVDGWGTCEELNAHESIKWFEDIIYSNNDINYFDTSSRIEELTTDIDDLQELHNSKWLYYEVLDNINEIYISLSPDAVKVKTREAYYNRQLEIKDEILDKYKEKLTLLYKISESQKYIESFYKKVDRVCRSYALQFVEEEDLEEKNNELILKYKEEFNEKLGSRLDRMSRQTLEQLSVKLLSYVETAPIFKNLSTTAKYMVKLKIAWLKAAIDDRL